MKQFIFILIVSITMFSCNTNEDSEELKQQQYPKCQFQVDIVGSNFRYEFELPNNNNTLDFETYLTQNGEIHQPGKPLKVYKTFYNTDKKLKFSLLNGSGSVIYLDIFYKTNISSTGNSHPFQVPKNKKRVIILDPDLVQPISSYIE